MYGEECFGQMIVVVTKANLDPKTLQRWNCSFSIQPQEYYDEDDSQNELDPHKILEAKRKEFEQTLAENINKMPVMRNTKVHVPVVFVDSFVNHPKWKYHATQDEVMLFNQELADLTRFLAEHKNILKFGA